MKYINIDSAPTELTDHEKVMWVRGYNQALQDDADSSTRFDSMPEDELITAKLAAAYEAGLAANAAGAQQSQAMPDRYASMMEHGHSIHSIAPQPAVLES